MCDSLLELAQLLASQHDVQFVLAGQQNLKKLAIGILEIREQPEFLEDRQVQFGASSSTTSTGSRP